jgi:hypothetical protein
MCPMSHYYYTKVSPPLDRGQRMEGWPKSPLSRSPPVLARPCGGGSDVAASLNLPSPAPPPQPRTQKDDHPPHHPFTRSTQPSVPGTAKAGRGYQTKGCSSLLRAARAPPSPSSLPPPSEQACKDSPQTKKVQMDEGCTSCSQCCCCRVVEGAGCGGMCVYGRLGEVEAWGGT